MHIYVFRLLRRSVKERKKERKKGCNWIDNEFVGTTVGNGVYVWEAMVIVGEDCGRSAV